MDNLEEFNYINDLFDIYGKLLTDKQIEIIKKYYKYNLSLSEISGELKISRNAVLDSLNHSKEKLFDYENRLHILNKINKITEVLNKNEIPEKIKEEIIKELNNGI